MVWSVGDWGSGWRRDGRSPGQAPGGRAQQGQVVEARGALDDGPARPGTRTTRSRSAVPKRSSSSVSDLSAQADDLPVELLGPLGPRHAEVDGPTPVAGAMEKVVIASVLV